MSITYDMDTARCVLIDAGIGEIVSDHIAYRIAVALRDKVGVRGKTDARQEDWISLGGYSDPPKPPEGHIVEVWRSHNDGIVSHYRFVPVDDAGIKSKPNHDSHWAKNWDVV